MITMRWRKIYIIGAALFLCWNIVMYYVFINSKQTKGTLTRLSKKLSNLQDQIHQQIQENDELLEDIKRQKDIFIKKQKSLGISFDFKSKEEAEPPAVAHHSGVVIPVLVIACNRPTVRKCIDLLIKYRPSKEQFPIIVSQDCDHEETAKVIQSYGDQLTHIQQPDQSNIYLPPKEVKYQGYYRISRHYKWALGQVFNQFRYNSVIIVEDDLDVAVDFFEYFLASYSILIRDPTLYCVSAWNDNGKEKLISQQSDLLYRTDFFPGLGWMMTQNMWSELEPKWPNGFWDDWIREPEQRKGRSCIRPEISRTDTFGKVGVSKGLFFEQHLKFIRLNTDFVEFTKMDLSYLIKENYDPKFLKLVYETPSITVNQLTRENGRGLHTVRIQYSDNNSFKSIAKVLGIMVDFKAGVPRTGYLGIITFMYNNIRVYLAPAQSWTGYDPTWS
ncbi:alpha-1,3-mannosyl-glycoprotein 2-beta-N-acetylglucosaminyltransferase-like [Saccoglossus kowalevskii]|uniref:Alpha-1,3-mannosyl-glycoprotein 2-beta-N-acetylglucosaminyltransferase n=1 Tax=Saccoglossus kowalevskii TaxID=10224 RepID=A0ABM0MER7_SACKO|nr:PREDICTED: alpha-1,3-mannosyl-glycoprotein 2-beta-N-acetylglucosaminyltransferase-like [Saccoglossus kowalevskii]